MSKSKSLKKSEVRFSKIIDYVKEIICTLVPGEEQYINAPLEKELKIFEFNEDDVNSILIEKGASKSSKYLVTDIFYDTSDNLLKKNNNRIRIRLIDRNFLKVELTHKGPKVKNSMGLKIREELTRSNMDFKQVSSELIEMGLEARGCIEKYRIDYTLEDAVVSIYKYPNNTSLLEIESSNEKEIFKLIDTLELRVDKEMSDLGQRKALKYLYKTEVIESQLMLPIDVETPSLMA